MISFNDLGRLRDDLLRRRQTLVEYWGTGIIHSHESEISVFNGINQALDWVEAEIRKRRSA